MTSANANQLPKTPFLNIIVRLNFHFFMFFDSTRVELKASHLLDRHSAA
jgi:hypothetical protein